MFPYSAQQKEICLEPLLRALKKRGAEGKTLIAGIHGGQGTGKTTLTRFLASRLSEEGWRVVSFSIDDFYTSYEERKRLAAQYPGQKVEEPKIAAKAPKRGPLSTPNNTS